MIGLLLASCAASGPKLSASSGSKVSYVKKANPKEYFAESTVGVKASPRVVNVALSADTNGRFTRLPRGGGRDMVGKPYKIRGRWYNPMTDPNYEATGTASWYGDAFHGRLTANGEIYDMNNLTAAHPTMPLPSYARVTNLKNGKSTIVRVNDRGPYANDRLVDLSKRAAQMLDYTQSGTAQVRLEYIGRAPVDGRDDEYLIASYREGETDQRDVMVAENDVYAEPNGVAQAAFAADDGNVLGAASATSGEGVLIGGAEMRGAVPSIVERQDCADIEPCNSPVVVGLLNGYASIDKRKNSRAFDGFKLQDTKSASPSVHSERVLIGSFSAAKIKRLKHNFNGVAVLSVEAVDATKFEVFAEPSGDLTIDNLLREIWRKGYSNAFVVR